MPFLLWIQEQKCAMVLQYNNVFWPKVKVESIENNITHQFDDIEIILSSSDMGYSGTKYVWKHHIYPCTRHENCTLEPKIGIFSVELIQFLFFLKPVEYQKFSMSHWSISQMLTRQS